MGFGRQKKDTGPKKINQVRFIEDTDKALKTAMAPDTKIEAAVEGARSVSEQLAAIHAGKLVVEPPLSHDQFTGLRERTEAIISIGEKATASLAEAEQVAEQARAETASSSFVGTGSGGKG